MFSSNSRTGTDEEESSLQYIRRVDEYVEQINSVYGDTKDNTEDRKDKIKLEIKFGSTEIPATGTNIVTVEYRETPHL